MRTVSVVVVIVPPRFEGLPTASSQTVPNEWVLRSHSLTSGEGYDGHWAHREPCASRLPCRRLAELAYAQVGLVPHRVQDVRHHEPEPSLGARLSYVLLPLAFVEPTERPGHLPGLLEDLLDQGSLMIVLDIQIDDALIQVHHADQLLAVGSPQPDPFHRLAPYDGISDTLRRARDGGRGPRPFPWQTVPRASAEVEQPSAPRSTGARRASSVASDRARRSAPCGRMVRCRDTPTESGGRRGDEGWNSSSQPRRAEAASTRSCGSSLRSS